MKKKKLYNHICILVSEDRVLLKNNTFQSWKNNESKTYFYMLKLIKSVYKTFSNRQRRIKLLLCIIYVLATGKKSKEYIPIFPT